MTDYSNQDRDKAPRERAIATHKARLGAGEVAFFQRGVSPFEAVEQLGAVIRFNWNEVFEPGEDGQPVLRPWQDIPEFAKHALTSICIEETVVSDDGGRQVIKRKVRVTRDDKLKAITLLNAIMNLDALDAFRLQKATENEKRRGLSIDLREKDKVYGLEDVDEKTIIARLLDE